MFTPQNIDTSVHPSFLVFSSLCSSALFPLPHFIFMSSHIDSLCLLKLFFQNKLSVLFCSDTETTFILWNTSKMNTFSFPCFFGTASFLTSQGPFQRYCSLCKNLSSLVFHASGHLSFAILLYTFFSLKTLVLGWQTFPLKLCLHP